MYIYRHININLILTFSEYIFDRNNRSANGEDFSHITAGFTMVWATAAAAFNFLIFIEFGKDFLHVDLNWIRCVICFFFLFWMLFNTYIRVRVNVCIHVIIVYLFLCLFSFLFWNFFFSNFVVVVIILIPKRLSIVKLDVSIVFGEIYVHICINLCCLCTYTYILWKLHILSTPYRQPVA